MEEAPLKPAARILLWDYDRLSWPYVVLVLAIVAFVLLIPPEWLGDPMAIAR